ncbi:MAG: 1-(5-phosphoribosyl)-5-[(5-phosphoribosylamino)methylideneamino]imidazole-4-carboxamide isomerase [Chloroflexota bacterium]
MIIYPAIDLRQGRCVRLQQGDAAAETVFAADPADAARRWVAEGAAWLHVVNLDGALGEAASANLAALERILRVATVPVQFGGGLRTLDDVARLLELGVARVILGTAAVRQPELVQAAIARHGAERVLVGIDARDGQVAIHGWVEASAVRAVDLARQMGALGVTRIVYTDICRDGMLTGVNAEATAALTRETGLRVIASGGAATLDDVRRLRACEPDGVDGVVIGMALYRGAIALPAALRVARGEE